MDFWFVWGEICRVMAALCLVTALAAAASAGILLVREKLTERLSGEWASGSGRRTMILTAAAVCIWILVIGQSAFAAEVLEETASGGTTVPSGRETEFAAPIEPGERDEQPPVITIEMEESAGRDSE